MGRPKKQVKFKEPVRLREKPLKDGNRSLYLDIYNKGIRKYEYLKLYLIPETTQEAKLRNKETLRIAEEIKTERNIAIQNHGIGEWENMKMASMPFVTWMENFFENTTSNITKSSKNWRHQTRKIFTQYLNSIHKPSLSIGEVNKEICLGFVNYLRTAPNRCHKKDFVPISPTTGHEYMITLGTALNYAVREGLIPSNPMSQLSTKERIKVDNKEREFLTIEELKAAINTDYWWNEIRVAFLFSCFTGLRISDVRKLSPKHIFKSPDGSMEYICIDMEKTKHDVIVPLSDEARKWLPEPKGDDVPFFELPKQMSVNRHVKRWIAAAGIDKNITFHCSRHTFATMMLTIGTDIYTTSKLLGHNHVSTTEIYAKVIDKKKMESMNQLDMMFNNKIAEQNERNIEK